ncbi:hypothetical protein [Thalassobius sp. I31.1]|nr:hypothetical protein [Thalassobius sp. I31.1]
MLRTILVSNCISVQGMFVRNLQNGRIVVRVGAQHFSGTPVANA